MCCVWYIIRVTDQRTASEFALCFHIVLPLIGAVDHVLRLTCDLAAAAFACVGHEFVKTLLWRPTLEVPRFFLLQEAAVRGKRRPVQQSGLSAPVGKVASRGQRSARSTFCVQFDI